MIRACALALTMVACSAAPDPAAPGPEALPAPPPPAEPPRPSLQQQPDALIAGTHRAIAYSGFREGQSPGGEHPSREQVREDMHILAEAGFTLIRLYHAGQHAEDVLAVIAEDALPIRVVQGAWLDAELSAHETCAWLSEPIPEAELASNAERNQAQVQAVIALAQRYPELIAAVNVGNEALVTWNDHLVSIESMVAYLETVSAAIEQPVTTADNYVPWVEHAEALGPVVDFAFVHSYPVWEGKDIDQGLPYTIDNLQQVRAALPDEPIAIGEAGWVDQAEEFGERASPDKQTRYVRELWDWGASTNTTVFMFEAFDEPWKGDPSRPLGAEKHWGLYTVDRQPKPVMR